MIETKVARRRLIATAAVAALLSACGGSSGEGDAGDGDAAGSLTLWTSGDTNEGGGYAKMAELYEEETGVAIEVVDVPNADYETRLRNAAQANSLPDLARVTRLDALWIDQTADLTAVADSTNLTDSLRYEDPDGAVRILPTDVTAQGVFVNKTLFDEAGVSYPTEDADVWAWEEFIAAVTQVQESTGAEFGLVYDRSGHRLRSMLYQFGSAGFPTGDDGMVVTDDETKSALEYFKSLHTEGTMPESVWVSGGDPTALFKSGQVAAYISGNWQISDFSENITGFEWASALLPSEDRRAVNLGGGYMVAFDNGDTEASEAFLSWLYEEGNYAELATTAGYLPVLDDLDITYETNDEAYQVYRKDIAASDPVATAFSEQTLELLWDGKSVEGDPLQDEVVKYISGEIDVDTTVDNVADAINDQIG